LHVLGVADLAPERARASLERVGWAAERFAARTLGEAVDRSTTWVGADAGGENETVGHLDDGGGHEADVIAERRFAP